MLWRLHLVFHRAFPFRKRHSSLTPIFLHARRGCHLGLGLGYLKTRQHEQVIMQDLIPKTHREEQEKNDHARPTPKPRRDFHQCVDAILKRFLYNPGT